MDAEKKKQLRAKMEESATHLRNERYAEAEKTLSAALEIVREAAEDQQLAIEMGYDKKP